MGKAIAEFLDFLSPGAVMDDLKSACRRLVDGSDVANCISINVDSEHDAIAEGILQFILTPNEREIQEIVFDPRIGGLGHRLRSTNLHQCFRLTFSVVIARRLGIGLFPIQMATRAEFMNIMPRSYSATVGAFGMTSPPCLSRRLLNLRNNAI